MKKFASGGEDSTEAFPETWREVVRKESSIYEPRVCRWRCFGSFSLKQNQWIQFVLKFDIFSLCFFVSYELNPSLLFPTSLPHRHFQKQEPRGYQGLLTFLPHPPLLITLFINLKIHLFFSENCACLFICLWLKLPDLASKNIRYPVKCKFQVNKIFFFFSISASHEI